MTYVMSERMRYLLDVEPAVRKAKHQTETRLLRDMLAGDAVVMGARVRLEFVDEPPLPTPDLIALLTGMLE